jgi:hypothetical protein
VQLEDTKSPLSQIIDRYRFMELIPQFLHLFRVKQEENAKLQIIGKCLAYLTKSPQDKTSRLTLIQENNLSLIFDYLNFFKYDEPMLIILFDILDNLFDEMNNKLYEILYEPRWNLMGILKRYLEPSRILGTYYSQNVKKNLFIQ